MTFLWIALPAAWKLQDVQAGLNVVITVLCALSIFVFARICWQSATAKVAKQRNVPLAALLSVNTLGEVYDVLMLLGFTILSSPYVRILLQCVVVSLLTVTAFLSGPIARYSTRHGYKIVHENVTGLLANRLESGISNEILLWNETETALNQANFPMDQLLDFLPDNSIDWQYRPDEWNSSWSMSCQNTEASSITLNVDNTNCTTLGTEIPALNYIFNESSFDRSQFTWQGITGANHTQKEVLMFRLGWKYGVWNQTITTYMDLNVTIMALRMANLTQRANNETVCQFGPGPVGLAVFTKAECALRKVKFTPNDLVQGAYPDHDSLDFVPMAYTSNYQGRFTREATAKEPITLISPAELVRFYQVYQITQSTLKRNVVARWLDVQIQIVTLSTLFVIITSLFALFCLLGIFRFGVFAARHYRAVGGTPESKLDWMLQSINASNSTPLLGNKGARHSVTSFQSEHVTTSPRTSRRRSDFETSVYGLQQEASAPYHSSWLSRQSSGSRDTFGYSPINEYPPVHEGLEANLLTPWTTPTMPATFDDYNVRR